MWPTSWQKSASSLGLKLEASTANCGVQSSLLTFPSRLSPAGTLWVLISWPGGRAPGDKRGKPADEEASGWGMALETVERLVTGKLPASRSRMENLDAHRKECNLAELEKNLVPASEFWWGPEHNTLPKWFTLIINTSKFPTTENHTKVKMKDNALFLE